MVTKSVKEITGEATVDTTEEIVTIETDIEKIIAMDEEIEVIFKVIIRQKTKFQR